MNIKNITVIGSGTMGNGIAHVAAQSGLQVLLIDVKQEFLDRAKSTIIKNLSRQVKKEIITQADADATMGRIKFSDKWHNIEKSDFVPVFSRRLITSGILWTIFSNWPVPT